MFRLEGEWRGYRCEQDCVVHRRYYPRREWRWIEKVKAIGHGIRFTDGTLLILRVTEVNRRKEPEIHGYDRLIDECAREGVSAVEDLARYRKGDGGSRTSPQLVECPECSVRLPAARHRKKIGMGVVPVHSPAPRCSGSGNLVNVIPTGDENRPCSNCGKQDEDLEAVSGDEWLCQKCYKALMSWMEQRREELKPR